MAPTKEEERKLKECRDDSLIKLGPAERFLKAVVDIPHAFKRVEALLYVSNFESEVDYLKKSFATLEVRCGLNHCGYEVKKVSSLCNLLVLLKFGCCRQLVRN